MKSKILLLLLTCLCSLSVFAQSPYSIKGVVSDTTSKSKLMNASISVLNSKDSILVNFTWAKADGSFSITNLPAGKFILLVSYREFADYVTQFSLDPANTSKDFGQVNLILKATLLAEVVVKGAAINIKGDTTVFNASSYTVQANARVEDLLKQLPGIQVDQNGKITAQGQPVKKVLVDGEEFFGDDPTLVTKNIRADMVQKIELFDKKSDQAKFTGVDDGVRDKTLNVVLRADSKNGFFGKVDAGGGGGDKEAYYTDQLMFNSFKTKSKFAVYGTLGNTSRTGLGSADNAKYGSGGGGAVFVSDGGVIEVGGSGGFGGVGLPTSRTGGAHYDAKWGEKDKETINMNYKGNYLGVEAFKNTLIQNNLPTGSLYNNTNLTSANSNSSHKVDGTYTYTFNPTTNLRVLADASISNNATNDQTFKTQTRANGVLQYKGPQNIISDGQTKALNMSAFFSKRFKKVGRTMSVSLNQTIDRGESEGYNYTSTSYYNTTGILDSTGVIDQYKPVTSKNYRLGSNMSYNEPLSKTFSLSLSYGLNVNNSISDKGSFNKSASGKYDVQDKVYSNNLTTDILTNTGGVNFIYNKDKTNFGFGVRANASNYDQTDYISGKKYSRNYLNWNPNARYSYRFNQTKSFSFSYNGTTTQPSINQLQPVKVNDDPLNITIGNPDLKPSYGSSMFMIFSSFKQLSGRSFQVFSQVNFTGNSIIPKNVIDAAGKSVTQFENLKGKSPYNLFADISTGTVIKKPDIRVNAGLGTQISNSYSYINGALNKRQTGSYSLSLRVSKTKLKKYDYYVSMGPGYTVNTNSVQTLNNNNRWTFNGSSTFNVFLPGKTQLGLTGNYRYQEGTVTAPQDISYFILNTTLSKKFLKKENLIFSLSGNDLLNQNTGFSSTGNGSSFTQTEYNTIKRYALASLVWDFTRMGPAKKKGQAAGSSAVPATSAPGRTTPGASPSTPVIRPVTP